VTTLGTASEFFVVLPFAIGGGAWGLAADRIAAHWPRHEDGSVRPLGLRSLAVVVIGGLAAGALPLRFADPSALALLGVWFAVLVLLMAVDLDQRLLPDALTLPLIPAALVVLVGGWNPLLSGKDLGLVSGIAAAAVGPSFLAATNWLFRGGLGMGDLKLSVSLGLVLGLTRFWGGFFAGALVFAAVALILLAGRRIAWRSTIPLGPLLVLAGLAGALLGPGW
jgi:leader peptidase (prepilin peptidase)/N-methyltransferase